MVFDVKLDAGFTRKARFVADGSKAEAPSVMTFTSVVSRDSVRITLMLAALNGLDVKCGDVVSAYLNAPPRESVYFTTGDEFGIYKGRVVVVVKALYGLSSSAAAWASAIRELMRDLGFLPCKADGDVWMQPAVDTSSLGATEEDGLPAGEKYYKYVLIHTDDVLVASCRATQVLEAINAVYKLKENKKTGKPYGPPDIYLGSQIKKYCHRNADPDSPFCYLMSGDDYIEKVVADVNKNLMAHGRELNANQRSPFTTGYRPELDVSLELNDENFSYFQELIGILRWAVELGRADIAVEVSLLSRHLALPRRGQLDQCFNIFAYLKAHPQAKLLMDPDRMYLDEEFKSSFSTKNRTCTAFPFASTC